MDDRWPGMAEYKSFWSVTEPGIRDAYVASGDVFTRCYHAHATDDHEDYYEGAGWRGYLMTALLRDVTRDSLA